MVLRLSEIRRRLEGLFFGMLARTARRKILVITGCGRSGTTYSAEFLSTLGLRIGHERLRRDGIASWYLASAQATVPFGPSMRQIGSLDMLVVHQVRDPIQAIASAQVIGRPSWEFLAEEIPIDLDGDSRLLMAMKYYYYWNLKASNLAKIRVRVEEFQSDIRPVLLEFEVEAEQKTKTLPSKSTNARAHSSVSWRRMEAEDWRLCKKIRAMSRDYGYEPDEPIQRQQRADLSMIS